MVVMADSDNEDLIIQQVKRDNLHFKALLNLVPPQSYFSQEDKLEILGGHTGDTDDEAEGPENKKRRRLSVNPFTTLSVTEIIEKRHQGGLAGAGKQMSKPKIVDASGGVDKAAQIVEKHKGKKLSRSAKGNKNKGKELEKRESRQEELKEKLRKKLEEVKAQRNAGDATPQELKKLKRQQKKMNAKAKKTNKTNKEQKMNAVTEGTKSQPEISSQKQNKASATTKFDFSVSFKGDTPSRTSDLRGRDYKRLLEKVEKRKEKVEKLKEKDLEKGKKLEEKFQWQAVLSKARGEKVKDDPNLLKKAAKRKDKMKEKRKKSWDGRVKTVEESQQKRQQKRQTNIQKRKNENKDKKRKKLIKKGRILPGL
ncbi:unnamed protein product [Candidula unifasciata]|uniref:Ribosomal RNA-processing protein 14/surfeit locus protein 6 C-terminal domain-containing protein n=1 Tax=Candidula unifasciata TaxID=100452 RepID=A0A8S3YS89_9EUPU|nr:unnamed protein product [Candidula unifasciata]